jgi:hypothetical protein
VFVLKIIIYQKEIQWNLILFHRQNHFKLELLDRRLSRRMLGRFSVYSPAQLPALKVQYVEVFPSWCSSRLPDPPPLLEEIKWAAGQPDKGDAGEYCVHMKFQQSIDKRSVTILLSDRNCSHKYVLACQVKFYYYHLNKTESEFFGKYRVPLLPRQRARFLPACQDKCVRKM